MMMFNKLNVLTVIIIFNTLGVYATTTEIKVRFGAEGTLQCDSMSGSYDWTIDGVDITTETSGIDSDTVHSRTLDISSMNQLLVGMYECRLNGQLRNTFHVKIVGLARYSMCQDDPEDCSKNFTYSSTSNELFVLNASIVFVKSGTDCCRENLLDPVWEVIVPPGNFNNGQEIRNSGVVYPPGINITIETGNDLITNIANVTIRNASVPFQITHLMHTNVDDNDVGGGQISITFNFNYTEATSTTTMASSTDSPTPSATSTMSSMPPKMTSSSTSQTSSTAENIHGSSSTAISLPSSTPSNVNVTPTDTPVTGDSRSMDENDDGSSGVIIGVVVSIVVIFIVGAAIVVAVFFWRHRKREKYIPTLGEHSETAQSIGVNVSSIDNVFYAPAPRPTTIQLNNSETPLLNLTGPNAYTSNATPQPIDGAPMPYRNGISNDFQNGADDDVDDSCFDEETNDGSAVQI